MRFFKAISILFIFLILVPTGFGQPKIIDQVVAVVGDNTVLQSDIENMYLQYRAQGITSSGDMKCEILEEFLDQMLLLNQAKIDSIVVSESQVELQLDARLDYFINQIGSQERLEEYFNKSVLEIKEDFRDLIRDQLVTQQMHGTITGEVTVTPSEVKQFYNKTSKDSLPYIDSEIELRQIVMYPPVDEEAILEVRQRLLNIRRRIVEGENFKTLAVLYSEGPSAPRGGDLGFLGRGEIDPAYAKAAFSLKAGQVSNIVESAFGYHIIQLIERRDDKVNTRHILMKPKVDPEAAQNTILRLDTLVNLIRQDSIQFELAARIYSEDKNTNVNGGLVINPMDNSTRFRMDDLQPAEFEVIRNMNIGEISQPFESIDENNKKVFKIIKLTDRTRPHLANLKEDYIVLQSMALTAKRERVFQEWINEKIETTYIVITDTYKNCTFNNKGWESNR